MHPSVEKKSLERTPKWDPDNLQSHYDKRLREEDCRKIYPPSDSGRRISESEYRELSEEVVNESWAEATFYDNDKRQHRRFYADGDLVLAITSEGGRSYITCYHKHIEESLFRSDCEMMMERTEDDRKEMFRRWVEDRKRDGRWQKVNWIQPK